MSSRDVRISPLVDRELERDRQYHPNLGGVTRGGLANHYPMTILAMQGLGASDEEVLAFGKTWPRHRASIESDLHLVDQGTVTIENWTEYLGRSERLVEFRRVFEELLSRSTTSDGLDVVGVALSAMRNALPMGLFHPLIRLSFAVAHGDRGLIADALAYMAIRHFDLYRVSELPRAAVPGASRSAAAVWRQLGESKEVARRMEAHAGGASIRVCEELCADEVVQKAALAGGVVFTDETLSARMPEVAALALRLYLHTPSLTTLHAVTAVQALAEMTLRAGERARAVFVDAWARYWIWLTALYLEKGAPGDLPTFDREGGARTAHGDSWADLAARARTTLEVHLMKMTYSCRWLDDTFGPDPLYKVAVANMLRERRAHPRQSMGLVSEAL
jgi:hypothetical protein